MEGNKMKLSEAIRIGAAKRPQAFGAYALQTAKGVVCTCAIGAAYEGATGQLPINEGGGCLATAKELGRLFPCLSRDDEIWEGIIHMNDVRHMTREEIAAALEERGL